MIKECKYCKIIFDGVKKKIYCSIKCSKANYRLKSKEYLKKYFKKRYIEKTKINNRICDYDKLNDSSKRDENGRFIKGSKSCLGKHWKVEDTLKMKFKKHDFGFKKGNKLGLGKSYMKGRGVSLETRNKMSESHKKNIHNHHWWKGGATPLIRVIRRCYLYVKWRKDIFTKDGFKCIMCGIKSGHEIKMKNGKKVYLEADHYPVSFAEIFHKNNIQNIKDAIACNAFWNIDNGRTLCTICHLQTPNHGTKYKKIGIEK